MSTRIIAPLRAFLVALALFAGAARAELPATLSGSWYDPVQAGHGLSIEMLGGDRAIAYWFVYDELGAPVHLYLDGRVEGRTILGPAYLARGMRFGTFDRGGLALGHWGELAIAFESCDRARLRYDANGPAGGQQFGRGDIALSRLSSIGELACAPNTFPFVAPGVYRGLYESTPSIDAPMRGLVDGNGRLWATSGTTSAIVTIGPTTIQTSGPYAPVVVGAAPRHADTGIVADAVSYHSIEPNAPPPQGHPRSLQIAFAAERVSGRSDLRPFEPLLDFALDRDAAATARVAHPWTLALLQRRHYAFEVNGTMPGRWLVRLGGYGFCLAPELSNDCTWYGEITVADEARSEFTFVLRGPSEPGVRVAQSQPVHYRGTGWIEWNGDVPAEIVLVADGPFGVVARLVE
jgi:hypothetical protein